MFVQPTTAGEQYTRRLPRKRNEISKDPGFRPYCHEFLKTAKQPKQPRRFSQPVCKQRKIDPCLDMYMTYTIQGPKNFRKILTLIFMSKLQKSPKNRIFHESSQKVPIICTKWCTTCLPNINQIHLAVLDFKSKMFKHENILLFHEIRSLWPNFPNSTRESCDGPTCQTSKKKDQNWRKKP